MLSRSVVIRGEGVMSCRCAVLRDEGVLFGRCAWVFSFLCVGVTVVRGVFFIVVVLDFGEDFESLF